MCIVSRIFPSDDKEEDNADHNAEDAATAAPIADNDDKDNDGTIMPPRVKSAAATTATKTAKKKPKKANEITHLPAPKLSEILNFPIKAEDFLTILYYANGKHNYADVVFRVNGTMEYGEYKVRVAKDGCLILFVHAIHARLFDKIIQKES
jgi:hypothetical protein